MSDFHELVNRWQQCWQDYAIDTSIQTLDNKECDRVFDQLIAAYTQPDRHYHNLHHIHHVLINLDRFGKSASEHLSQGLQNPVAVSLAAWFHDFVYDSQASDNEMQSARAAGRLLANIGASRALIERVQQLVLATQGHQIAPDDRDLCIFLDADLAILGTNPLRYQAYQRSIRREYQWVPDDEYRVGRIRVLTNFLQRDKLYHTDLLFGELESIARINMQQEITSIS